MIIFWLIAIVLFIFTIQFIAARKFESIAIKKGYDESIHSFAMCFWLGMVGYLYVIALPDLNNAFKFRNDQLLPQNTQTNNEADIENNRQYYCPKCNEIIHYGIECCPMCGQQFDWDNKSDIS